MPADKTDDHIGISETLVATAAAGFVFSIFSGQPLIILGTTGPLLLFDESLYQVITILKKWDTQKLMSFNISFLFFIKDLPN